MDPQLGAGAGMPSPGKSQAQATLIVTGPAYAGKTTLIQKLVEESSEPPAQATGDRMPALFLARSRR